VVSSSLPDAGKKGIILMNRINLHIGTEEAEMERVITVTELRSKTRDIMEEAKYKGQRIIVETFGKPMAAIVGVEDYQKLVELEKQEDVGREKRLELLRQAAARNDMTEEEAVALAEEARQWAYEQQQAAVRSGDE